MLATFPEMGKAVPEFRDKQVRELIEGSYRIIYEILSEDMVLV
ncbi:type II toxin-antitoxin system RelE/ParE family toxin [uncultured Fibrella sp.]